MPKKPEIKDDLQTEAPKASLQLFTYPSLGVSFEAASQEEADEKAAKLKADIAAKGIS